MTKDDLIVLLLAALNEAEEWIDENITEADDAGRVMLVRIDAAIEAAEAFNLRIPSPHE